MVSNLAYRFEDLIDRLPDEKAGINKLVDFFIANISRGLLKNISVFEKEKDFIFHIIKWTTTLDESPTLLDRLAQMFPFIKGKIRLNGETKIDVSLIEYIEHSSAIIEDGSIYLKGGHDEPPFQYPLQKFSTKDNASNSGFSDPYLTIDPRFLYGKNRYIAVLGKPGEQSELQSIDMSKAPIVLAGLDELLRFPLDCEAKLFDSEKSSKGKIQKAFEQWKIISDFIKEKKIFESKKNGKNKSVIILDEKYLYLFSWLLNLHKIIYDVKDKPKDFDMELSRTLKSFPEAYYQSLYYTKKNENNKLFFVHNNFPISYLPVMHVNGNKNTVYLQDSESASVRGKIVVNPSLLYKILQTMKDGIDHGCNIIARQSGCSPTTIKAIVGAGGLILVGGGAAYLIFYCKSTLSFCIYAAVIGGGAFIASHCFPEMRAFCISTNTSKQILSPYNSNSLDDDNGEDKQSSNSLKEFDEKSNIPSLSRTTLKQSLYNAINDNNEKLVLSLIERKASVNDVNDQEGTPIYSAVQRKNVPIVKSLLEARAIPDQESIKMATFFSESKIAKEKEKGAEILNLLQAHTLNL